MTLRVVGAGVGRTGTKSLKQALEHLLDGPCYHMLELFSLPEHVPVWHNAVNGGTTDWRRLFSSHRAAVDWPASAFYEEIAETYPDAIVLLSVREPESWWRSAENTIFPAIDAHGDNPWSDMVRAMMSRRFTPDYRRRDAAIAAFEAHNARARAVVPSERLLEWQAKDGWEPICAALDLPVPDLPFPHTNTSEEWAASGRARSKT